jgi:hypothetical protein
MFSSLLIHNSPIRCKITKFISFLSKNQWKSLEKTQNKYVDILSRMMADGISTFLYPSFPQSYEQIFLLFFHLVIESIVP